MWLLVGVRVCFGGVVVMVCNDEFYTFPLIFPLLFILFHCPFFSPP